MREKIHHNTGSNAELFTEQEGVGVLVKAFTVNDKDQLIHPPSFQEGPDFVPAKDANKFQSPNILTLDRSSKLTCGFFIAHHCHMAYVEDTVFREFHQNDSIRNKK